MYHCNKEKVLEYLLFSSSLFIISEHVLEYLFKISHSMVLSFQNLWNHYLQRSWFVLKNIRPIHRFRPIIYSIGSTWEPNRSRGKKLMYRNRPKPSPFKQSKKKNSVSCFISFTSLYLNCLMEWRCRYDGKDYLNAFLPKRRGKRGYLNTISHCIRKTLCFL